METEIKPCPNRKNHEICECNRFKGAIDGRPHCKWCGILLEGKDKH